MNSAHRTVAASLLAAFTVVIDNTKVNVALPTLAKAFAVDETTLQWIVESYVLAFAALLLLDGMRVAFAVAAVVLGLAAATTARSAGATAATAPGAPAAHR